ncbi:mitochondrial ribosomal protein L27-domain-containing protein [Microdochium bolleyi]|uniref:Mitochondrial ribosomal protein L27-domain-containing protein n=1 Tax=Microdochium bolleyi TaxID=196109 RepID=A0A136JHW4_9PEZI|nr:mitochondrial ribosomal protein L27-domain-containing protein [Microdochium bolleyi]
MKATAPLLKHWRKLPLTTKDINKGFYKGNRTGSMGRHTKYGGYVVDYSKVRTYVVPDLKGFQLTPFVTNKIESIHGRYEGYAKGPRSPELYLERWKTENGLD